MTNYQACSPIAFLVFNRPHTTQKVFAEIAKARPPKLLIVADGPRPTHPDDPDKCAQVRSIVSEIDWDCEVLTNFADSNLGLRKRVSSGLDWVFEQVEEAIVLEDDCLPDPTFFQFCDKLLDKYRHDERVMSISGTNFQRGLRRTDDSYYFSRYLHIWGWAAWRRSWQHYDVQMSLWPNLRDGGWLKDILNDPWAERYWAKIFQRTFADEISTWDYQWTFACWVQGGLNIIPNQNLISNIGFGPDATHTVEANEMADTAILPIDFPLRHPATMIRDSRADQITQKYHYDPLPFWKKVTNKLQSVVLSRLQAVLESGVRSKHGKKR